jgi:Zn-dependent M28 family amino/carboxypeptidase
MVIKNFLTGLLVITTPLLWAQPPAEIINDKETGRIINVLAADEMRGRKAFTPEIDKAADFIAAEFKAAGLKPFKNADTFLQEFSLVRPRLVSVNATMDRIGIDAKNIIVITCQANLEISEKSGYEKVNIKAGANLQAEARKCIKANRNMLVMVEKSFANSFGNLSRLKSTMFKTSANVFFVLTDTDPKNFNIIAVHTITEQRMANVVGVLSGKKSNSGKEEEFVIFSGHYDHLGIGRPVNGDSIYNGANDDAAGITAVIMLAKYFKALNKNERTLVFVAFTAEEVGGYGSQYFSRQMEPKKIMAMFNIEMIGTESKWGKNSAYITGYEKTNMGDIMAKDLEGTGFTFYPDPYPQQQLFYRSDNATLARLGVPAHTISTSKMDTEPHYHQLTDHVETLDLQNMTAIIKAIALSAKSIIAGTASPSRVKQDDIR